MSNTVALSELTEYFRNAGIDCGDTVFLQSALRTVGDVEGGAETVIKALQSVVGEEGTIVVPTFCFLHEIEEPPVIDPLHDASETGVISETLRLMPGAKRSVAYRHSVAALGKNAATVCDVDREISPFDIRSSFGRMLGLDTKVVLLGVEYLNSTSHHFAEYVLKVPDREVVPVAAKLKDENGDLTDITVADYRPKANASGEYYAFPHDFNRMGYELEKRGLSKVSAVGNAICRVFKMRDLIHFALDNYSLEYNLFAEAPEGKTVLPDGEEVTMLYKDGADRDDLAVWSVVDKDKLFKKDGKLTSVNTFAFGRKKS